MHKDVVHAPEVTHAVAPPVFNGALEVAAGHGVRALAA
jgi:hypothetical protein